MRKVSLISVAAVLMFSSLSQAEVALLEGKTITTPVSAIVVVPAANGHAGSGLIMIDQTLNLVAGLSCSNNFVTNDYLKVDVRRRNGGYVGKAYQYMSETECKGLMAKAYESPSSIKLKFGPLQSDGYNAVEAIAE